MDETRVSGAPENHPPNSIDRALDQEQFNEWLSAARASDDVRNRIAVAGDSISYGVFGRCHLLVLDERMITSQCSSEQVSTQMQQYAANDDVFEKVAGASSCNG